MNYDALLKCRMIFAGQSGWHKSQRRGMSPSAQSSCMHCIHSHKPGRLSASRTWCPQRSFHLACHHQGTCSSSPGRLCQDSGQLHHSQTYPVTAPSTSPQAVPISSWQQPTICQCPTSPVPAPLEHSCSPGKIWPSADPCCSPDVGLDDTASSKDNTAQASEAEEIRELVEVSTLLSHVETFFLTTLDDGWLAHMECLTLLSDCRF